MTDESKVALITGAARGIGLATARRFLEEGWRVALLDIDGETLERAASSLERPGETMAIVCDVADPALVAKAVASVKAHFGRLDSLVNNAGVAVFKPMLET